MCHHHFALVASRQVLRGKHSLLAHQVAAARTSIRRVWSWVHSRSQRITMLVESRVLAMLLPVQHLSPFYLLLWQHLMRVHLALPLHVVEPLLVHAGLLLVLLSCVLHELLQVVELKVWVDFLALIALHAWLLGRRRSWLFHSLLLVRLDLERMDLGRALTIFNFLNLVLRAESRKFVFIFIALGLLFSLALTTDLVLKLAHLGLQRLDLENHLFRRLIHACQIRSLKLPRLGFLRLALLQSLVHLLGIDLFDFQRRVLVVAF